MSEDAVVAALYRRQAESLRAQANGTPVRKRDKILRLAAEYEWRAASLEAAMALLK